MKKTFTCFQVIFNPYLNMSYSFPPTFSMKGISLETLYYIAMTLNITLQYEYLLMYFLCIFHGAWAMAV